MPQVEVIRPLRLSPTGGQQLTVENRGSGNLFYGREATVSATNRIGTLTEGERLQLTRGFVWVVNEPAETGLIQKPVIVDLRETPNAEAETAGVTVNSAFGAGTSSGNLAIDHGSATNGVVYRLVTSYTGTLWDIWIETRTRTGTACWSPASSVEIEAKTTSGSKVIEVLKTESSAYTGTTANIVVGAWVRQVDEAWTAIPEKNNSGAKNKVSKAFGSNTFELEKAAIASTTLKLFVHELFSSKAKAEAAGWEDWDSAESDSYSQGNPEVWLWEATFAEVLADGTYNPNVNLAGPILFNPYYQRRNTSHQQGAEFTNSGLKVPVGNTGVAVKAGEPIAMIIQPVRAGAAIEYSSVNHLYTSDGLEGAQSRNQLTAGATDVYYGVDGRVVSGGSNATGTEQWYPGNNFNHPPFTKHLLTHAMVYSDGTRHGQEYFSAAEQSAPTEPATLYTMNYKVPQDTTFTAIRAVFWTADTFKAKLFVNGVESGEVTLKSTGSNPGRVTTVALAKPVAVKTTDAITITFETTVQNAIVRIYSNSAMDSIMGHGTSYYAWLTGDEKKVMPIAPVPWPYPRLLSGAVPTGAPSTPTNLTAEAGPGVVNLGWSASPESYTNGYQVYRDGVKLGEATTTEYSDTSGTFGKTYEYKVLAVGLDSRTSALSAAKSAASTTPATILFVAERQAFTTGVSAGTTVELEPETDTVAGNHLVCIIQGRNSSAVVGSVTDAAGNTWSVDVQKQNVEMNTFAAICSTHLTTQLKKTEKVKVKFAAAPGPALVATLEEYSGIKTTNYLDRTATSFNTSTLTALTVGPTAATRQPVEVAVAAWALGSAAPTTMTAGTGYTGFTTKFQDTSGAVSNRSGGQEYKILAAVAAQTATATLNTGISQIGVLATYRSA